MGVDIKLELETEDINGDIVTTKVYEGSLTHALQRMASLAAIDNILWRPSDFGKYKARSLISPLAKALQYMQDKPKLFIAHNPGPGSGTYDDLFSFVRDYLAACEKYPEAKIHANY